MAPRFVVRVREPGEKMKYACSEWDGVFGLQRQDEFRGRKKKENRLILRGYSANTSATT